MAILEFVGPGVYTTGDNEETTTTAFLASTDGEQECVGGTWNLSQPECSGYDVNQGCTITVSETDLHSLTLNQAGGVSGRIKAKIECKSFNRTCGVNNQARPTTFDRFTVEADIYDCEAGY